MPSRSVEVDQGTTRTTPISPALGPVPEKAPAPSEREKAGPLGNTGECRLNGVPNEARSFRWSPQFLSLGS